MNIVIITQTFPLNRTDATAHFMYDFAQGLQDLGHAVTVVLPFHPQFKNASFPKLHFVPFRYIWPDRWHLIGFGQTLHDDQYIPWHAYLLFPFFLFFETITLFRVVKATRAHVIHAHWIIPNGISAASVSLLTGVPLIVTLPGTDVYLARTHSFLKIITRFVLHVSKIVISNSQQLLTDLHTRGDIISYGVPSNRGKRPKHSTISVATAGRPVEKKGFALVKRVYPRAEIISELPIDAFRKKLLATDIFLALSVRDTRGNLDDASLVVFEAMAAGCAVIASDLPGYRSIITSGQNGILVSPQDTRTIKKILTHLIQSKKLRQSLGAAARRTIARSFTPQKIAARYIRVYTEARRGL